MDAIFAEPVVQTALLPMAVGLVFALMLMRVPSRWQGLAMLPGFLAAVVALIGPELTPLTSTRKIVLASLVIPLLALGLGACSVKRWPMTLMAGLSTLAALVWVLWPVLSRQTFGDAALQAGWLALYVGVVIVGFARLSQCCARFAGAAVGFSVAVGATMMLGSSALYGQLSFALAAAVGGVVLPRLFQPRRLSGEACFGFASAMAVAVPLSLLSAAATVYASVPLKALPFLAAAPLLALMPLAARRPAWLRMIIAGVLVLLLASVAVYWVWLAASEMDSGGYY